MSDHESRTGAALPRRGLLLGAGAAAVGATLAGGLPAAAKSAPTPPPTTPQSTDGTGGGVHPHNSPVVTTIASAPHSGVIYRHAAFWDFTPEPAGATRAFGGHGVYTNMAGNLWASMEIPSGATIFDIEWYVFNHQTAADITSVARLFVAGNGTLATVVLDIPIPFSSAIKATRGMPPASTNGPYPVGTKLFLSLRGIGTEAVQVEGVRVGFTRGAGTVGSLPTPIRAYDSRVTGGKLHGGTTRTITLPSAVFSPGVSAIEANVTAVNPAGNGYLTVYPASSPAPATSSINYTAGSTGISNAQTIGVSSAGQIKVFSYATTDFIIDVTGIIG